ncbi:Tim44 domain-containing protein [Desulfogranum japonicum]|uniref:Tim44 domain-containing protein n=1 Tax=Desulfogranum japonicum TaxID=231447 RepID=UPI000406D22B|nr:Tim44 domain-containing protein [Desulfogranum japonicum]
MQNWLKFTPLFLVMAALLFCEAGITTKYADAKSMSGGKRFSRPAPSNTPRSAPSQSYNKQQTGQKSSFGRGLAGGLLGGALGGLLFGSMFGMGGSGMGILPLLVLGVVGYILYKKFINRPTSSSSPGFQPPPQNGTGNGQVYQGNFGAGGTNSVGPPPVPPEASLESGLAEIRMSDPGFDDAHFIEVASDVFFQVQAGWMRRDLDSYRHLLGTQLASEYEQHFKEMKAKGHINKLESIAIRKVEMVDAGSVNGEDFVTVLFTANLLDYTVDDTTGDLISGSMTQPIKFAEKWTWARPIRTENWKLEGIEEVG